MSETDWIADLRRDGLVVANLRRDGLAIKADASGNWIVLPADDRAAVSTCPCCAKPLATPRAARLVADAVYPMHSA